VSQLFALPLRDTLSFALWGRGFVTRHVYWRDDHYHVTRDGSAQLAARPSL
jgi:hypothetical protein